MTDLVVRGSAALTLAGFFAAGVRAEPHLAIRAGLSCASCHVNRTGGGGRTAYGASYGATQLPAPARSERAGAFDGSIHPRVRIGGDARAAYVGNFQDDAAYVGEYRLRGVNVYLAVEVLEDRLTLYADERIAPGGALSREAFVLLQGTRGGLYAKAGRFFLPYGLRLLDDEAATRRGSGFTFEASDTGVELGGLAGGWSWAASATNGRDGGAEADNGKQFVGTLALVRAGWRAGLSASTNDLPGPEKRELAGVFAGARAGPIVAIAAADILRDVDDAGTATRGATAHVEIDATPRPGFTLRGWWGAVDPDDATTGDGQTQLGVGVDWTPWPALQIRAYFRDRAGTAPSAGGRGDEVVAEVHLYF
ncbi:MAG TPA: hypothetical protein VF139_15225 [Candidatus Polarisedimenticolaceae bacterium]